MGLLQGRPGVDLIRDPPHEQLHSRPDHYGFKIRRQRQLGPVVGEAAGGGVAAGPDGSLPAKRLCLRPSLALRPVDIKKKVRRR